jgi:hypothetical protein
MPRSTNDEREAAERRARRSFEVRKGLPYTDEEWREAKANLVAFFRIAIQWQLQAAKQEKPPNAAPTAPPLKRRSRR